MGHPEFGNGEPKSGVWWQSSQTPTDFYGFRIKNTHVSTLFTKKGHTGACSECSHYRHFSSLYCESKRRSLAKINERRLQPLLV